MDVVLLAGDGIGPEIMHQAEKLLILINQQFNLDMTIHHSVFGGQAIEEEGQPLPIETLKRVKQANAVLLGAVGGPRWDNASYSVKPEQGLLQLRSELDLFANYRPAILFPELADVSSVKLELIKDLDLLIIRELVGGIYFGKPRGITKLPTGEKKAVNTMVYTETEIERLAHIAFQAATQRQANLCSVDKANVLEVSQLWRDVMNHVAEQYPKVRLTHMYVDNAAMQLIRAPKQFDVVVTSNLFGDILSDCAAMLTGSIGMLPSASLNANKQGVYEPVHGSAPDIAGQNKANPLAMILSVAMMCQYSLNRSDIAKCIHLAVREVLANNYRTEDIFSEDMKLVTTEQMGDNVCSALQAAL